VEMAENALAISAAREKVGQAVTAEEIKADHMVMLEGEPLDPTTMVDPAKLTPVE
jgi:hypothetical protein